MAVFAAVAGAEGSDESKAEGCESGTFAASGACREASRAERGAEGSGREMSRFS